MTAASPIGRQKEIAAWRTLGDEPLRFRSWDGDYIVYSPFSGQTHRLNITAGYLIELLIDGPKNTEILYKELSKYLEGTNNDTFRRSIYSALETLYEEGLIENISK